jgi:hypothetical protein
MNVGDKVIVRSSQSGCWYGRLAPTPAQFAAADTVTLIGARRLWRWWAAEGVSLSGVAAAGLHRDHLHECRIAAPVAEAVVLGVCEVLAVGDIASASIEAQEARA